MENNIRRRICGAMKEYSAEAMRLLKRMPHVATYADTDQNSGYERVQYCEEAVQLLRRMPHVAMCWV